MFKGAGLWDKRWEISRGCVDAAIGEGLAAIIIENGSWVGSLTDISYTSGYWVKTNNDCNIKG